MMRAHPTRQGVVVALSGVVAGVFGRAFGIIELFVIAAAMAIAPLAAWLVVVARRPRVRVRRWIRPAVLTAGDTGRVEVVVESDGPQGRGDLLRSDEG